MGFNSSENLIHHWTLNGTVVDDCNPTNTDLNFQRFNPNQDVADSTTEADPILYGPGIRGKDQALQSIAYQPSYYDASTDSTIIDRNIYDKYGREYHINLLNNPIVSTSNLTISFWINSPTPIEDLFVSDSKPIVSLLYRDSNKNTRYLLILHTQSNQWEQRGNLQLTGYSQYYEAVVESNEHYSEYNGRTVQSTWAKTSAWVLGEGPYLTPQYLLANPSSDIVDWHLITLVCDNAALASGSWTSPLDLHWVLYIDGNYCQKFYWPDISFTGSDSDSTTKYDSISPSSTLSLEGIYFGTPLGLINTSITGTTADTSTTLKTRMEDIINLSDVRIYNKNLEPWEISSIYNEAISLPEGYVEVNYISNGKGNGAYIQGDYVHNNNTWINPTLRFNYIDPTRVNTFYGSGSAKKATDSFSMGLTSESEYFYNCLCGDVGAATTNVLKFYSVNYLNGNFSTNPLDNYPGQTSSPSVGYASNYSGSRGPLCSFRPGIKYTMYFNWGSCHVTRKVDDAHYTNTEREIDLEMYGHTTNFSYNTSTDTYTLATAAGDATTSGIYGAKLKNAPQLSYGTMYEVSMEVYFSSEYFSAEVPWILHFANIFPEGYTSNRDRQVERGMTVGDNIYGYSLYLTGTGGSQGDFRSTIPLDTWTKVTWTSTYDPFVNSSEYLQRKIIPCDSFGPYVTANSSTVSWQIRNLKMNVFEGQGTSVEYFVEPLNSAVTSPFADAVDGPTTTTEADSDAIFGRVLGGTTEAAGTLDTTELAGISLYNLKVYETTSLYALVLTNTDTTDTDADGEDTSLTTYYTIPEAFREIFKGKTTYSTLVRNYIPAIRLSDKEVGLYETVGKKFYTNANSTGKFYAGSPVIRSSTYH